MQRLQPTIEDASKDYVLVQAWKKASTYIRYHNWFSDTLELDYQTANLPEFLESISREMQSGDWRSDPIRLVLAPKSQEWQTPNGRGLWKPRKRNEEAKLRPLAHVSLRDQIASTALMLCLADRAETAQGDPRVPKFEDGTRRSMVSYGNRLFCDNDGDGGLTHRWGSSKLYRSFSEDYRRFVERPELVAKDLIGGDQDVVVVQSDLSQFYDRVRPGLLMEKLHRLAGQDAGPGFLRLLSQVMNWTWHEDDTRAAHEYASANKIEGFNEICLPQGLVSSGFFANIALLDFDRHLVAARERSIGPGILLHDSCRYVDDLRLVVTTQPDMDTEAIEESAFETLGALLSETAPGLLPSRDKTEAANFRGDVRPLLRQSRKMERIQYAVSGGFDVARGEEIIDAVQSLVRAQQHYSRNLPENKDRASRNGRDKRLPVPDVKDATVARFAAARFRTTYRSLRPLLFSGTDDDFDLEFDDLGDGHVGGLEMTKADLDEEAHNFALNLIQNWIDDPSNVRLLRIGLDIWPSLVELGDVLELLRPYALSRWDSRAKRAAAYCLSEVFKAGATETGFVKDQESLPDSVDVAAYRARLADEALLVLAKATKATPWYLQQQALLLVAVTHRKLDRKIARRIAILNADVGTQRYVRFIEFLEGDFTGLSASGFANFAIMARRSILSTAEAQRLVGSEVDDEVLAEIATRDPGFALELRPPQVDVESLEDFDLFGSPKVTPEGRWYTLSTIVGDGPGIPHLRHEVGVTSLLAVLADWRLEHDLPASLPPSAVEVQVATVGGHDRVMAVRITSPGLFGDPIEHLYQPPSWCPPEEVWRFQMGYLVRFILTGNLDFTSVPRTSWRELEPIYRPVRSHWYQRLYAMNNAMEGFGDDWLAISETTEELLYSMLAWPGCRDLNVWWQDRDRRGVARLLEARLADALACIGKGTETLLLKIKAPLFDNPMARNLRGCVVQTITPHEFSPPDLSVSGSAIRKKHRKHLATALAAVEKMLDLRATHSGDDNLDWLILPELSVHPEDIERHLVPFARRHRTIILAGLTYEELKAGSPLVNSAMWILPQLTPGRGLQMKKRRQGKYHLAAKELVWQTAGLVRSFRPCQWLVGYVWDANPLETPLWLSAAVCYDATDLGLAADLRLLSDVFAIPALNQDVGTFDQMAAALHYHMYQMVIVANNGRYGGSNAHTPKREHYNKQVFHTHGQPQASISFFEIEEIADMKDRHRLGKIPVPPGPKPASKGTWKYPPAGS